MDVADRTMDAAELARWTRFAAKGGIGKCTAIGDCVAEAAEDLMFLKNDEIVVLMQLQEDSMFLGYCEGIVGRFHARDVHFHSKLKKPVMTKRSSVSAASMSGKTTPTPTLVSSPSPKPGTNYYQNPPSPQQHSPSPSQDSRVRNASFSSTTMSLSASGSTSASFSTALSSPSLSSEAPDTPPTVYSPEPMTRDRLKHLDTSSSMGSMETNVGGRSSPYIASVSPSVSTLNGDDGDGIEGSSGRNRKSETTTVEMWPTVSPSSAIARKPINGSRLALAMLPPPDSEDSDDNELDRGRGTASGESTGEEEFEHDDDEWAGAVGNGTLPLQVIKLNSAPPSPAYQGFPSSSSQLGRDAQPPRSPLFQQHTGSSQLQNGTESESQDSDSEYNTSDPEDHDGDITLVAHQRDGSFGSDHTSAQHHHQTPSLSHSVHSIHSPGSPHSRAPSSGPNESISFENNTPSFMHENTTRLSIAAPSLQESDDGEVGIGLSLLQGLMGGGDDASDDSDDDSDVKPMQPPQPASRRQSVASVTQSIRPHADDWDGQSDIYDDYYRFSKLRSSTSTFASGKNLSGRLSHGSHRGVPSSSEVIPPVPVDPRHESQSEPSQKRGSADSDASVYTQASRISSVDPSRLSAQQQLAQANQPAQENRQAQENRPSPLILELRHSNTNPVTSPLLHTRWGSPISSVSPTASSFLDTATTPTSASSGSLSSGGAASAMRQRIELDRGTPSPILPSTPQTDSETQPGDGLGRRIVIEDDEEPPIVDDNDARTDSPEEQSEPEEENPEDDVAQEKPALDGLTPLVITELPLAASSTATLTSPSNSPQSLLSTAFTTPVSPSSPPDISPPPSQTNQQQQHSGHQPRPSLSELRGHVGSARTPSTGTGERGSLFLPHPNAPKPPPLTGAEGPMYIREPPPPSQQKSENVVNIIKMSIGRSTVTRVMPTIYGRTDVELGSATGPVRIVFGIDPLPSLSAPLPSQMPFRNGAAAPKRIVTDPGNVPGGSNQPPAGPTRKTSLQSLGAAALGKSSPLATEPPVSAETKPTAAIPRPNFFPKAGTSRPRSRSFSGFNTELEIGIPLQRSKEDGSAVQRPGNKPSRSMSALPAPMPRKTSSASLSSPPAPSSSSSSSPPPPSLGKNTSRSSLRARPAPSPLSLPHNNSVAGLGVRTDVRSPTSPLALSPVATAFPSNGVSRPHQLRQMTSRSTLNELSEPQLPPASRPIIPRAGSDAGSSSQSSPRFTAEQTSPVHTRNVSLLSNSQERPSTDTESIRSQAISPSPGSRESLRSKLSLPNLRRNQSRQSTGSGSQDNETVQVQDMDFELVRPSLAQLQQSGRSSEDSLLRESSVDGRGSALSGALRDSPTVSISPAGNAAWSSSSASESSIDAHRQRELKWVSLMGAVPPAQARKNKKVKKLLMDGSVPSSVRFLVWSHLTDGKAKNIPGVYAQLGKRARVAALGEIAQDVQRCSVNHPQMQSNQGSLMSLLQAYLTMVPDIQYNKGLTLISGHLLALSPEEDAFWIFVSIMDSYLRPYFSSNTTQIEVDAALFSRALESSDAQVAKKVLVDMSINPVDLCLPWFSTLFVDALPLEYLNRVWDLFLFEGIPFLFRVGLALFYCCRRRVLEVTNEQSLFDCLSHPSPSWLPPSPDTFIALAYSFKLKDDDVRKQRVKMEAQVKRQAQTPRATTTSSSATSFSRI